MRVRQDAAPHLFAVESETDPEKWYQVFANGTVIKCTCRGYLSHRTCKHLGAVQQYLQQTEGGIEEEETGESALSAASSIAKWIKKIHGRDFIHIPPDFVVAQEASEVESSSRLDFLVLHNLRR